MSVYQRRSSHKYTGEKKRRYQFGDDTSAVGWFNKVCSCGWEGIRFDEHIYTMIEFDYLTGLREDIHTSYRGPMTLMRCGVCGSIVESRDIQKHAAFHADMGGIP